MPSWKKLITSGSTAHLNNITASGNISGSATSTGSFGSVQSTTLYASGIADTRIPFGTSTGELVDDSNLSYTVGTTTLSVPSASISNFASAIDFNSHNLDNVDIDSGTIDNTTIGITTPSTGYFTNITASGDISGSATSTGSFGMLGVGIASPLTPFSWKDTNNAIGGLADETGGGEIVTFGSEHGVDTLGVGKLMFLNTDGDWEYTNANSVLTGASQLLGIAMGSSISDGIMVRGFFDFRNNLTGTFNEGIPLYVSTTDAKIQTTRPSGNGDFVRIVGWCASGSAVIYFNPSATWVTVQT